MVKSFTLMELLIVIAIIGILSAISYPMYTHHVARTQHHQAKVLLLEMAGKLEEQHVITGTYKGPTLSELIPQHTKNLPYRFALDQATKNTFTLSAIPTDPNNHTIKKCRVMRITEDGDHCR